MLRKTETAANVASTAATGLRRSVSATFDNVIITSDLLWSIKLVDHTSDDGKVDEKEDRKGELEKP